MNNVMKKKLKFKRKKRVSQGCTFCPVIFDAYVLQEAAGEEITLEIFVNGKKIDVLRFAQNIDSKNDPKNFIKITNKTFLRRI